MVEKNEIIDNEEKIAETFNAFFTNIVSNLKIPLYQDADFARGIDSFVGNDSITFILEKYKKHRSTIAIKIFCHENKSFNFGTIKRDDILEKIKSLDISKTSQNGDVQKQSSRHRCFPVNFAKFLRTPFLQKTSCGCF